MALSVLQNGNISRFLSEDQLQEVFGSGQPSECLFGPFFQWLTFTPIHFICQDVFQARTVSCWMTKSFFKCMTMHFALLSLEKSNQIPLLIKNCGSVLRGSKVGLPLCLPICKPNI